MWKTHRVSFFAGSCEHIGIGNLLGHPNALRGTEGFGLFSKTADPQAAVTDVFESLYTGEPFPFTDVSDRMRSGMKLFLSDRLQSLSGKIYEEEFSRVEAIAEEIKVGRIYNGKVSAIKDFGAFRGSVRPTRIRMVCCDSTFRRAPI